MSFVDAMADCQTNIVLNLIRTFLWLTMTVIKPLVVNNGLIALTDIPH